MLDEGRRQVGVAGLEAAVGCITAYANDDRPAVELLAESAFPGTDVAAERVLAIQALSCAAQICAWIMKECCAELGVDIDPMWQDLAARMAASILP